VSRRSFAVRTGSTRSKHPNLSWRRRRPLLTSCNSSLFFKRKLQRLKLVRMVSLCAVVVEEVASVAVAVVVVGLLKALSAVFSRSAPSVVEITTTTRVSRLDAEMKKQTEEIEQQAAVILSKRKNKPNNKATSSDIKADSAGLNANKDIEECVPSSSTSSSPVVTSVHTCACEDLHLSSPLLRSTRSSSPHVHLRIEKVLLPYTTSFLPCKKEAQMTQLI
jgi:hypothetical protein